MFGRRHRIRRVAAQVLFAWLFTLTMPGMETGTRHDPYQVLLIDRAGRGSVYASYPK